MMLDRLSLIFVLGFFVLTSCKDSAAHKSSSSSRENSIEQDSTGVKENLVFSEDNEGLDLPEGFKVLKVAENVGRARRVVVRKNGDIYVSLNAKHNGGALAALRDTTGDGKADVIEYFGDLMGGTGLRIHKGYLYFGSDTAVVRFKLNPNKLVPDTPPELVASLPVQHEHQARSLAFDDQDNLYVNIGAPSNSCQKVDRKRGSMGMDPCPLLEKYGAIWQFKADELGQTQENGGTRYVTGIRNCVALDWNANADKLYAVMHGRDQLSQNFPELYNAKESAALPAERFLKFKEGANYGWPYVYWDPFKEGFVVAPEYGGDGKKMESSGKYEKPIMSFPGHWAPNGLLFYSGTQFPSRYQNGAFVAFHGSWNRAPEPQKGYKIVFVPFDGEAPSGDYEVFADNFAGTEGAIQSPGDAQYRPCGLSQGPEGSLYVSDDRSGAIFRIVYKG